MEDAAAAITGCRGLGTTVGEVRVAKGDSCNAVVSEWSALLRDVVGVLVGFAVGGFCDVWRVGFTLAFFVDRESG